MRNVLYKVYIFLLLIIPILFNQDSAAAQTQQILISDSILSLIKYKGWDNSLLKNYQQHLVNNKINFDEELTRLKSFPGSFERSFLIALILKRQKNFKTMLDSLIVYLDKNVKYFPFYNELAFAAAAEGQLSLLEAKIEKKNNPESEYLNGLIFFSQGKYENALAHFQNLAKKDSINIYNNPDNFEVLYHLSYTYRNLGDYEKASQVLKKINNIDEWDKCKKLLAQGSLAFLSNNYDEAEKFYNNALNLAQKNGDKQNEAKAKINISIINDVYGNIEKARSGFKEAINTAQNINDFESQALGYSELGVSFSFTNELIKAKQNYLKSYALYSMTGNKLRLALLANNLGKVFMTMFDYNAALKYYQEGIDLSGENKRAQVLNLMGLADVYTNLSNYSKALELYREAKNISSQIKEASIEADIDYGLGSLYFNLDRNKSALDYFKNSNKLSKGLNPYLTAETFNQIGLVYYRLDSLEKAEKYFYNSLKIGDELNDAYTNALAYTNLALVYEAKNNLNKALNFIEKAKTISRQNNFKYFLAQNYLIEGNINKADLTKARNSCMKALELGKELNEFNTQIEANYNLAKLFENNNLNSEAESFYKAAVKLIEGVSQPLFSEEKVQIAYNSSKNEVYNSFANFYLKENKFKDAFLLIDKSRSQNTMNNLKNLKIQALVENDSLLNKIYDYEWMIHSGIYENAADSINRNFSRLKKTLIKNQPSLKKYLSEDRNLSIEEIQNRLNEDENFISIYLSRENIFIFLIRKERFDHFKINISKKDLTKLVSAVSPYFDYDTNSRTIFYNQDLFSFNSKAAYNLYDKILKPVFKKINKNEKVIISSPPELITMPFEFLITSYNDSESSYNYSAKNFLIYNYNISYTPSINIFFQQKENNFDNNDKVLLVGDPVINNKLKNYSERRGLLDEVPGLPRNFSLLPLKYSSEEVNQISEIFNTDKVLLEENATETNFKKNAAFSKVIHLSTHSFIYNKQPLIFFSNFYDPYNDGFLEAGEIVQMKLNSDLIVLSSCSSGLGLIDESEGIIGMTKAFFEAGAKSIVVSYWEVNDKYTSNLMELFYKKLGEGLNKSEALRMAKIEFIKKYSPNPYYWASFTLNGDVSKINLRTSFNVMPLIYILILILAAASVIVYSQKSSKVI